MAYMGAIESESRVSVRLLSPARNKGTATLSAGIGDGNAGDLRPGLPVDAGTSREITLTAAWGGMVQIHVEFERDGEVGELEIRVNGAVRDTAHIWGRTWWVYSVDSSIEPRPMRGSVFVPVDAADSRRTPRG
jgi:hypothetical protein